MWVLLFCTIITQLHCISLARYKNVTIAHRKTTFFKQEKFRIIFYIYYSFLFWQDFFSFPHLTLSSIFIFSQLLSHHVIFRNIFLIYSSSAYTSSLFHLSFLYLHLRCHLSLIFAELIEKPFFVEVKNGFLITQKKRPRWDQRCASHCRNLLPFTHPKCKLYISIFFRSGC